MNKTIKSPKKLGRPLQGTAPVSNRDRQQRWRDRVKADAVSLLKQIKESNAL